MWPRINPEDPLPKKYFWMWACFFLVFYIISFVVLGKTFEFAGQPRKIEMLFPIIILHFLFVLLVVRFVQNDKVCRRKHEELLKKYGTEYTNLLKEMLAFDNIKGHRAREWKDFEEEMVRRDMLKQARSIKE